MNHIYTEDIIKSDSLRTEDIADYPKEGFRRALNYPNYKLSQEHLDTFSSIMLRSAKNVVAAYSGLCWGSGRESEILIEITGSVIYHNVKYQGVIHDTIKELRQSSHSKWIPIANASTLGAVIVACVETECRK